MSDSIPRDETPGGEPLPPGNPNNVFIQQPNSSASGIRAPYISSLVNPSIDDVVDEVEEEEESGTSDLYEHVQDSIKFGDHAQPQNLPSSEPTYSDEATTTTTPDPNVHRESPVASGPPQSRIVHSPDPPLAEMLPPIIARTLPPADASAPTSPAESPTNSKPVEIAAASESRSSGNATLNSGTPPIHSATPDANARPVGRPTTSSDAPTSIDHLGRAKLVKAIAALVADPQQPTPLTIAIFGDWGAGKTSIMDMLEAELTRAERYPGRFRFARFNAWQYEHTNSMAAGLAQEVLNGVQVGMQSWERLLLSCRFACAKYGWSLVKALLVALFALITSYGLFTGAVHTKNAFLESILGAGSVAAAGAFFTVLAGGIRTLLKHPIITKLGTYLRLPKYDEHLGLIPTLRQDIRTLCSLLLRNDASLCRLVVFVDDLDRCNSKGVTDTLDAIRLVMDIENVIVVLGIDHRIALKAVGTHYAAFEDGARPRSSVARDYLGKIVNLPIRLLSPSDEDLERYVKEKLFSAGNRAPSIASQSPQFDDFKDAMSESESERSRFYALSKYMGMNNPRQLVRLRNAYRVLKALDVQSRDGAKSFDPAELMTMLFWEEYLRAIEPSIAKQLRAAMLYDSEREFAEIFRRKNAAFAECYRVFAPGRAEAATRRVELVLLPCETADAPRSGCA